MRDMHEDMREYQANQAIFTGVIIFIFLAIYLFVMYFVNHNTRVDTIELADATFEINGHKYSAYCELKELLKDPLLECKQDVTKRIGNKETATVEIVFDANNHSHQHKIFVTVKNVFEHGTAIQDSMICKLSIDINSIRPDCGIKFMDTPVESLTRELESAEWTDRFGQPEIVGSLETKKYIWEKTINGFESKLIITREFGNTRHLIMEIQDVELLFSTH